MFEDRRFAGDVFTVEEVAEAAGVEVRRIERALRTGEVAAIEGRFIAWADAVALGREVRRFEEPVPLAASPGPAGSLSTTTTIFGVPRAAARRPAMPAAVSAGVHASVLAAAVLVTSAGLGSAPAPARTDSSADAVRLVFLALPGPGGGGGGGGLRQRLPPPRAMRKGAMSVSSPMPDRKPPVSVEPAPPKPEPPPPPPAAEAVKAPVATVASDQGDQKGVLEKAPPESPSRGPGAGGGVGTGTGTGIGEGDGTGLGDGEGGGTGGGPYRPGSGIDPPRLLREVKPDYTDEARRAGIVGEVLLEIVVRRDGGVGDVSVVRGLGRGLDGRAVDAVRQWRFSPARRRGTPVDVLVEVAVEFRLR